MDNSGGAVPVRPLAAGTSGWKSLSRQRWACTSKMRGGSQSSNPLPMMTVSVGYMLANGKRDGSSDDVGRVSGRAGECAQRAGKMVRWHNADTRSVPCLSSLGLGARWLSVTLRSKQER